MNFKFKGCVAEEWLFEYRIKCLKFTLRQKYFCGAAGFIVSSKGEIRVLTGYADTGSNG
ncbi:hypothetical protein MNBD_GAMMA12-3087 [hydrothermal vent metagenome]|uniref:Uncharacterized protein n=1 Tax=hydrothermal vent metagenome TaxID=652676 RepID=A0A3B0ZNJ3_9ZZZZ